MYEATRKTSALASNYFIAPAAIATLALAGCGTTLDRPPFRGHGLS